MNFISNKIMAAMSDVVMAPFKIKHITRLIKMTNMIRERVLSVHSIVKNMWIQSASSMTLLPY